jgi:hypothetical protein
MNDKINLMPGDKEPKEWKTQYNSKWISGIENYLSQNGVKLSDVIMSGGIPKEIQSILVEQFEDIKLEDVKNIIERLREDWEEL